MVKHRFLGPLIAGPLLLLCAAALAGCGNGSPGPRSVAALSSPSSASSPSPLSSQSSYQRALAYAQCMRTHGVPAFPDPTTDNNGNSGFQLKGGPGLDPSSAQFKTAEQACASLSQAASGSHPFDPTKIPAWVDCVRKHGVSNFPYPVNTGTGMQISISGIDQNTLQKALNACLSIAPGGTLQIQAAPPSGGN